MRCPKCGKYMEMYERFWDYDDGELLCGEEHYQCQNCDKTYSRDVTYVLEKEGDLQE